LPALPTVLVNPRVGLATKEVFAGWAPAAVSAAALDLAALSNVTGGDQLLRLLAAQENDLESAATALAPVIADVLTALRALPGCRLARMSGSGATCFGLFSSSAAASAAAKRLHGEYSNWWIAETTLG
jgi:4-diphosphocytidyl-2-C-methyl-D-erythritol kinase